MVIVLVNDNEKRNESIKIYVNEYEKQTIERKARKESLSVSTYCRRKLLNMDK